MREKSANVYTFCLPSQDFNYYRRPSEKSFELCPDCALRRSLIYIHILYAASPFRS